ncbi:MAG: microcin C transport system substrate-binding protein [Oleiphilaceae bacterium]|jgi:microcin C transport system substrate-binding protein
MTVFKTFVRSIILLPFLATPALASEETKGQHGVAMHGELKYAPDFTHFEYANPTAPKGGTLKLAVLGDNFDSFNPYILKGVAAAGVSYLYQTLTEHSEDEAFSEYALIAEKVYIPEDRSSVTFYINPQAKFSDGSNIRAEDVEFSFKTLTTHEQANPGYSSYYADVASVKVSDPFTIQFIFKNNLNKELPLILGQIPILSKAYWTKNDFGRSSLDIPIGNGPYIIESVDPGRTVTLKRDENYWAKDLPVNQGRYNFDKIVFEYYKDNTVALEAFKAGEYDFRVERTARNWANSYTGQKFDSGELIKEEISHEQPAGMQAFVINTRRELFKDQRVREALSYAFDFEWTNENLFNGQYARNQSYFENSELASRGLPSEVELELLSPLKGQIPDSVFTTAFSSPSTKAPSSIRKNLRAASKLLKEAGWVVENNKLINSKTKKLFTFEFLLYQKDFERVVQPFIKNLEKLGIETVIRVVDTTQYINRRRSFDFDVMVGGFGQSSSPGNEQREYWHSSKANIEGSRNLAGISSPAIDQLIELVISAPDRKALVSRTHALDRVLLAGHYVIPNWFNPVERIAYTNQLAHPEVSPKSGVSIDTWWFKQP